MAAPDHSPFRAALELSRDGDSFSANFGADWGQGRSIFGGIVAAATLAAMRNEVADDRPLRAMTCSFVGPVAPGPVTIVASQLRAGRSVTQMEARVCQEDTTRFVALASFGGARPSAVAIEPPAPPEVSPVDEVAEVPFIEGVTPAFTQHVAMRFAIGQFPFSGADEARIGGWFRFREPTGAADEEVLIALLDGWPPVVLSLLDRPAPSSTMTWSVSFLADARDRRGDEWWLFEAKALAASDGYAQTRALLWDGDGRAVASAEQTVAVFDQPAAT